MLEIKYSCLVVYRLILTTGTRSLRTSSMARFILTMARLSVSSTVISTWSSSLRCSQFGLPLLLSSYWLISKYRYFRLAKPWNVTVTNTVGNICLNSIVVVFKCVWQIMIMLSALNRVHKEVYKQTFTYCLAWHNYLLNWKVNWQHGKR